MEPRTETVKHSMAKKRVRGRSALPAGKLHAKIVNQLYYFGSVQF